MSSFSENFKTISLHRSIIRNIRWYSGFHGHGIRWNQAEYEEITIHPSGILFQLHPQFHRS
jgi:hypothetical protein